jgi:hypothetical protein
VVSGAGKPLAPAFAELGRESVWPVLLPFHGQPSFLAVCRRSTLACHHVVKLGKRKAGQGGSAVSHRRRILPRGDSVRRRR